MKRLIVLTMLALLTASTAGCSCGKWRWDWWRGDNCCDPCMDTVPTVGAPVIIDGAAPYPSSRAPVQKLR
jgi:hypothetical protein